MKLINEDIDYGDRFSLDLFKDKLKDHLATYKQDQAILNKSDKDLYYYILNLLDDMNTEGSFYIPDDYTYDPSNVTDEEAYNYFDYLIKRYNLIDLFKKIVFGNPSDTKNFKKSINSKLNRIWKKYLIQAENKNKVTFIVDTPNGSEEFDTFLDAKEFALTNGVDVINTSEFELLDYVGKYSSSWTRYPGFVLDTDHNIIEVKGYEDENESLKNESIIKTPKGGWVNKGKEGTHGEFKTKKAAREQQKAMFASGYKENLQEALYDNEIEEFFRRAKRLGIKNMGELLKLMEDPEFKEFIGRHQDIDNMRQYSRMANPDNKYLESKKSSLTADECQKWVDYDMKKYGRISNITNRKIKEAGFELVKDEYGDYEVIPNTKLDEDLIEVEPIEVEVSEPKEIEKSPTPENNGLATELINAINGEWDTIALYNDIIVNAETYSYPDIADVLRDIVNEENVHVGQLQKALETISPNTSSIGKGEAEAKEQLGE